MSSPLFPATAGTSSTPFVLTKTELSRCSESLGLGPQLPPQPAPAPATALSCCFGSSLPPLLPATPPALYQLDIHFWVLLLLSQAAPLVTPLEPHVSPRPGLGCVSHGVFLSCLCGPCLLLHNSFAGPVRLENVDKPRLSCLARRSRLSPQGRGRHVSSRNVSPSGSRRMRDQNGDRKSVFYGQTHIEFLQCSRHSLRCVGHSNKQKRQKSLCRAGFVAQW